MTKSSLKHGYVLDILGFLYYNFPEKNGINFKEQREIVM